ncbi:MAG: DUF1616 domain-containing protein [Candidatus Bathyarchaeota archaeon]|nr:DUF1616 domain-containing protein [Candidatus Termiticorpusculum sp.]
MSSFQRYRVLFLVIIAVLALIIASPLIERYVSAPKTEPLTEFSVLGSYRNATYPYNLTSGDVYPLYFTISNNLGSQANYRLDVKFRTPQQPGPDSFNYAKSSLSPLTSFTFKVNDGESVELQINLEFDYVVDLSEATLNSIAVNGTSVDMHDLLVEWDPEKNAYLGNIFFELYLYDDSTGNFQYNQRYLSLWVNLS